MSSGVYSFNTEGSQDKIKTIMKFIREAGRPVGSKEISIATGIHQSTLCSYLSGMHHQLGLISPSPNLGKGNCRYWVEGEDPQANEDDNGTAGRPIVKLTKAAEYSGPIPVDPMRAYLFGTGRAA